MNWDETDFLVMGALVFGAILAYRLLSARVADNRKVFVGLAILALFLYIWAELAVGIFTNLGS